MGAITGISWCDKTWNPWIGCSKVSPACDHCYAEELMDHRYHRVSWGAGNARVRTSPTGTWMDPVKWDRAAAAAGKRETVFCLSLGDIWDNEVDPTWRSEAFAVMKATPNLTYLLLSKRIGNAKKMCSPEYGMRWCLPENVAIGSTMVNQEEWDRDAPKLRDAGISLGARFTFASLEPMLGPINAHGDLPDWVIVGGESGRHARPMHPDWVRSMRDQCAATQTPFHFKQWGEWAPSQNVEPEERLRHPQVAVFRDGRVREWEPGFPTTRLVDPGMASVSRVGKKAAGARIDGYEHRELAR